MGRFDWATLFALIVSMAFTFPASARTVHNVEVECLALTIYFEARGEPEQGKIAVGYVVMNRVMDPSFPDTICAVVRQGGESPRFHCQFSWWCDGMSDEPTDPVSWRQSYRIAHLIYWGLLDDPTQQALWYHADYVHPPWKDSLAQGPTIGQHIFYNRADALVESPDRAGSLLASSTE